MNNLPIKQESTPESRNKHAIVIAIVLLVTLVAFDIFSTINYFSNPSQSLFFAMILSYAATAASIFAFWMLYKGATNTGVWVLILTTLIPLLLSPFLGSGLGIIYGVTAIVVTIIISGQGLEESQRNRANIIGVFFGILTIVFDFMLPASSTVNANNNFTLIILVALLGVLFFVVIRQFANYSLRTKLVVSFVGVTLIVAGTLSIYVYISTTNILRIELERELEQHTNGVAVAIGSLLDEQVSILSALSLNETLVQTAKESNQSYVGDSTAIQSTLAERDLQWRTADEADNNNDPLIRTYLDNSAAKTLQVFQRTFPENVEIFITDVYGGQAGTTNRTSDYLQSDEGWWQSAYNNGQGAVYISEPEYDESTKALAILIAMPLRDQNGKIVGILRTTYLASSFSPVLQEDLGETGETELFIASEGNISHYNGEQYTPFDPVEFEQIQSATQQGMATTDYEGVISVLLQSPVQTTTGNSVVDELGWQIIYHQHQNEANAPINDQTRGTLIVTIIVLALAVAGALFLSFYLVRPISQLTQTAEEVASGNLNSRAMITSTDEVGRLASTFNNMTIQLQSTLQDLEQRIADRTRDLAIVAEVGTATSSILETKRLLQEVVDLTKERFNLYHSHIYLLDEERKNLVLTAGAGEPGRIMAAEKRSIPLDREHSLVARAARERKGVTVNDVTQSPDFLPNPLLPDTHAELAVPMIVGDTLIGVFDIQSDVVGRFTDSDISIQTTLAAQLASSVQNARSYEQSKAQADFEATLNSISQKIQRAGTVEETLQTAIRELGTVLGAARVKATLAGYQNNNNTN